MTRNDASRVDPVLAVDPGFVAPDENTAMQYIGTDWRTALERNVTVSLEFALSDLADPDEDGHVVRARALIEEALSECERLLRASSVPSGAPARGEPMQQQDQG